MSTWGRAQDALHDLWESPNGYSAPDPGVVQLAGITREQWETVSPSIIAALAVVFGYGTPDKSGSATRVPTSGSRTEEADRG